VAAKIAFVTAGATGGTAGSPQPSAASGTRHEVHLDARHFRQAQQRKVIKVALRDTATETACRLVASAPALAKFARVPVRWKMRQNPGAI
jgi:hypothetical protein